MPLGTALATLCKMSTKPPPQMAGWIKMPLGTELDHNPDHIVLDENQLPLKGAQPPLAHVYCGQTLAHLSYCSAFVICSYYGRPM